MSADTDVLDRLKLLREPFLPRQIGKLPKGGVTLDFVGHAALTDRLLDVDPLWTWEPLALTEEGLPAIDKDGGLWIKLTICGVTRLGYGDAADKKGPSAMKERIGDALRNAGMRFGIALDLWHKGDLHEQNSKPTRVDEGAMKAAAEKEAAERAAAKAQQDADTKARQAAEAKQAFTEFSERANELGYKGDIKLLARAICKTDKPLTSDLRTAINAKNPVWIAAIDELLEAPATLDIPPTAEETAAAASAQTIGAQGR